MGDVVSLDEHRRHTQGTAHCLECDHEWLAIAPDDTINLECPKCGMCRGEFMGMAYTELMHCMCGEFVFFIDIHGAYCAHCGIRPDIPTGAPAA